MSITAVWFAVGWVLFVGKETLSHLSGIEGVGAVLYWQVQIITTVGYGDLHAESDGRRFIVALYILVGNMVAGVGVMDYLTSMVRDGSEASKKDLLSKSLAKSVAASTEGEGGPQALAEAKAMSKFAPLVKAFVGFFAMISVGTVFFSCVDYCICEEFETCDMVFPLVFPFGEAQKCLELGGTQRSVIQAFYMSCVTLTTVGFGDYVPGNWLGRLFATCWMTVGVVSAAIFLGQLARVVTSNFVRRSVLDGMSDDTFRMIDVDNSGSLTKYEYVVYMLINFDMVDADDVQELIEGFAEMDLDSNGTLEYHEVKVHRHHHHP